MAFRVRVRTGLEEGHDFSRAVKEPKENGLSP